MPGRQILVFCGHERLLFGAKVAHHLQMFSDFGRGFRRKCAQGWLLASLGIAGMKRVGIFMVGDHLVGERSEEHTSELQSLMRISYAVFDLKTKYAIDHTYPILNI